MIQLLIDAISDIITGGFSFLFDGIDSITKKDNSLSSKFGQESSLLSSRYGGLSVTGTKFLSVEKSKADTLDATLERIQNSQQATLSYQSDMNDWALNFRIWSTSVEVVASAAKKVSQGFQTLFRASG